MRVILSYISLMCDNLGSCVAPVRSRIVRSRTALRHTRCRRVATSCKASVTATTVRTVTLMLLLMPKSVSILLVVTVPWQIRSVNPFLLSRAVF